MDVVIYTRVSTEDQKENGFSLQAQERRLREHCSQYNKNILRHYQDDHSAKNFNRPAFQQMLTAIKAKIIKPKQLICVRPDRFSRNVEESVIMLQTLKKLGVEVQYLEQNHDLSIPENLIPHMLDMVLAQVDNERRGLNTKQGMRQALRQGRWMWKAPKGYDNDLVNKIIKVNAESKFIKKGFIEVAKGLTSVDAIRKSLNQEGFKCSKQQFVNLLRNHLYIGKILIKAWRNEPEEIVKGLHEAIVDEGLFEQVQDILNGKGKKFPKPSKFNPLFPLRGHLICKACGSSLTASSSTGRSKKYHYYHCQHGCKERIEAEVINSTFDIYLKSLQVNSEIAELYTEIIKDVYKQEEGSKEDKVKAIQAQVNLMLDKLTALDDKYLSGTIGDDDYKRMSDRLKKDISRLNDEKKQLEQFETNLDKHFTYGITFLSHLSFYYNNAPLELKHKIIDSIFPEKLIFENKKYRITKTNSLISLMCSESISKNGYKRKKAIISDGFPNWAPPPGLEPGTP